MKKTTLLLTAAILFNFQFSIFNSLLAQTIEVGDKPIVQNVQLAGGSNAMLSTPSVDVTLLYDVDNELLNIGITAITKGDDVIWIPSDGLDRGDMKTYTNTVLHYKCRMSRQFKQQIAFGVPSAMALQNAERVGTSDAVLLHNGESVSFNVKVVDLEKDIRLKLTGLVAAHITESVSPPHKITYNYVADDVTLNLKVKGDPCRLAENEQLRLKVMQLNAYSDSLGEDLKIARNRKDGNECRRLKKTFEDSVQVTYNEYMMSIGRVPQICPEIEDLIEFTADNIRMARMVKCNTEVTGGGGGGRVIADPPAKAADAAKRLKEETHELEKCYDAIKSAQYKGKDYKADADRAMGIISRMDEYLKALPSKVLENEQVRARRKSYEIMKQSIERKLK